MYIGGLQTSSCFVISGLGSHPFGSWQAHGKDKSFMWIRDELPHFLPGVRFLTYGYDTTLLQSESFQTISHLSNSLNDILRASGCSEPSSKAILFLAHSLGGVLLKQSLIALASGYEREHAILDKVRGAMFFGVPSHGMSVPDLFTMIGSQPNMALLDELSDQSDFLPQMDQQFRGISKLKKLHYHWAFETKMTHRVEVSRRIFSVKQLSVANFNEASPVTGNFGRTGTTFIMVPPESATGDLCKTKPHLTLQIDENHSNIVKFSAGDHRIKIIANKLEDICNTRGIAAFQPQTELSSGPSTSNHLSTRQLPTPREQGASNPWVRSQPWNHRLILLSLRAQERDHRLEQIDERVGNTFDWAFDDDSAGLRRWLSKGSGLFWVCGKPGSGKSTLMKYLHQDKRTGELLRASSIGSRLMVVSFFFHHRGNYNQRSFEGLLRSLVSQILEGDELLFPNVYPILEAQFRDRFESKHQHALENDIRNFFRNLLGKDNLKTPEANSCLREILNDQLKLTALRCLGEKLRQLLHICMRTYKHHDIKICDDMEEVSVAEPDFAEIQVILRLHYGRVRRVKEDLERSEWTREHVHEALRRLISQNQFKLNLLLILDALDEYDGRPEFIASFLQDLDSTQVPSTRLRILFSSRPWKVFNEEFASTTGFQIQDHTRLDIQELCTTRIPQNDLAQCLLFPLIPEIVTRARGVFVWVKLVITELLSKLKPTGNMQMTHLQEELYQCLESLPDGLDEFYNLIIERIPNNLRWDGYVILETISRSVEPLSVQELVLIVRLSRSQNFSEAQDQLEQSKYVKSPRQSSLPSFRQSRHYLETATGGLAEVVATWNESTTAKVQLMHQSVQDFVAQTSDLKSVILGRVQARLVLENGYSFLSKYSFTNAHATSRTRAIGMVRKKPNNCTFEAFGSFARQAEQTTGCSQLKFLQAEPGQYFFPSAIGEHIPGHFDYLDFRMVYGRSVQISSGIEIAAVHGLKLCLDDAIKSDPRHTSRAPDYPKPDLIGLVLMCVGSATEPNGGARRLRAIDTAEFLVSKGLSVSANMTGLRALFMLLWVPPVEVAAKLKQKMSASSDTTVFFTDLAEALVQAWCRSMSTACQSGLITTGPMMCSETGRTTDCSACRSLRLMERLARLCLSPDGTSALAGGLDHGMAGETPLDRALGWLKRDIIWSDVRALEPTFAQELPGFVVHVYTHVCLLVEFGGKLRSTSAVFWADWTRLCVSRGLSIRVFEDNRCPSWVVGHQPKYDDVLIKRYNGTPAQAGVNIVSLRDSGLLNIAEGPIASALPTRSVQRTPDTGGSVKGRR